MKTERLNIRKALIVLQDESAKLDRAEFAAKFMVILEEYRNQDKNQEVAHPVESDEYYNQLMKNVGRTPPYQFKGEKCVAGCHYFSHYETKHHQDCPFYPGSLSEKYDQISLSAIQANEQPTPAKDWATVFDQEADKEEWITKEQAVAMIEMSDHDFDEGKIIDFGVWYSGSSRDKVSRAYERYLKEEINKTL